ncbi:hypothetical protein I653_02485 [Bacillus subtilis subsp. subtilis str. BAB-1]|nr:hypothetical protein I653_02485 [Bacillus subtilis subsp. subtilis str. BAB-1]
MIWKKESATTKAVIIQMKTDKLFYKVIGIYLPYSAGQGN